MKKEFVIILSILFLIALWFRIYSLDAVGLSFDETHKIEAARLYRIGNFSFNLEHPMILKLLIAFSDIISEKINNIRRLKNKISDEYIVRIPNAFFGALFTIVIYLFAKEMFNDIIALLSATLWAIGINAIAINRIAKEDTLLVFFTFLGYYFYWKAKYLGPVESLRREILYILSGASFGLMLASKYFPHYIGLNFLFHYTRKHEEKTNYRLGEKTLCNFFKAFIITFALANFSLFIPDNIKYIGGYLLGATITHHGYEMMKRLYYNNFIKYSNSTPFYYYLLFLLVKFPPIILIMLIIGLIIIFKNHSNDGYYFLKFMFLFWVIPFSLLSVHWLRYTLHIIPVIYMISAIGIYFIYSKITGLSWLGAKSKMIGKFFLTFCILIILWTSYSAAPFYMFYVNSIGGGNNHRAYYFPHDEIYDAGVREAISYISHIASSNSYIFSDTQDTVIFYLKKFRRNDIKAIELSQHIKDVFNASLKNKYIIDQRGRKTFENYELLEELHKNYEPIKVIKIDNIETTKIYFLK